MKVYDSQTDQLVESKVVLAADRLVEMKKKQRPFWEVVDEVVKIWKETNPTKWRAYLIRLGNVKETRKDKKFASTKTKGSNLRYMVDLPEQIYLMLRALFTPEELDLKDRRFWIEFVNRYKTFKVGEKI